MEKLDDIKADAKDILLEMKDIGERGPSKENAESMMGKMNDLTDVINRLDDVPDDD